MKILMVCLGNICRSPIAHGIMQHKVDSNGLNWEIGSAGTAGYHVGELPDRRSIEVTRQHGIDITNQRSQKLNFRDLDYYDLIFAMDSQNYQDIIQLAKTDEQRQKVALILNEINPGQNQQVPDPYYGQADGFLAVYDMLDLATDKLIERLLSQ